MRVLVDYRPALRERSGVGEYIHALVRAYTRVHTDEVAVFTSSWRDRPAEGLARELGASVVDRRIPVRALNYAWHRLEWPPVETMAGSCDVVHAAHPLLIPSRRAAQVVTIHDLDFLSRPERTRAEIRRDYVPLAAAHARRADAVVTSTAHGKRQITDRLGVPSDRVHICTPGAPTWTTLGRQPHLPRDGYVLFIGTLEPRKNVATLLDAWALLIERQALLPELVLAGRATPAAALWLERLERPPLAGRVSHRGYVHVQDRERLFAGARLLVLPSFDEGFGLPALEAMSAGIPVVVSNRGALPEVVGDAGTLIEPDDTAGLANAIDALLRNDARATELAHAGLARARQFTWDAAANALRAAYLSALDHRRQRDGTAARRTA